MKPVQDQIMKRIRQHGQGYVFTPRDLIDLGTREAVDTALSRLVNQGAIRRLSRGLYDYPKPHELLGDLLPSLDDVAKAIARDTNSHLQISGAKALYLLGLTTQVPTQTIYLTDGRSKDIQIGNAILQLKHAGLKVMAGAGSKAGTVLQAIRYLGKNNLNSKILDKIVRQLNQDDKQALKKLIRYAPGWIKSTIDKVVAAA